MSFQLCTTAFRTWGLGHALDSTFLLPYLSALRLNTLYIIKLEMMASIKVLWCDPHVPWSTTVVN